MNSRSPYRHGGKARNDWEIPNLGTAVHIDGTLNDPMDRDLGWRVESVSTWKALAQYAHKMRRRASATNGGELFSRRVAASVVGAPRRTGYLTI
jgi:hypothetical protein